MKQKSRAHNKNIYSVYKLVLRLIYGTRSETQTESQEEYHPSNSLSEE